MKPSQLAQPPRLSAGYGRSCTNCSRAKCKCIISAGESICERCNRLEKECIPMTSSRRKSSKKPSSSRTAQLEEKLDDLVSILRASQGVSQQQQQQQQQPTPALSQHTQGSSDLHPSYSPPLSSHTASHRQSHSGPAHSSSAMRYPPLLDGPSSRLDSLAIAAASSSAHSKPSQVYDGPCKDISGGNAGPFPLIYESLLPTDRNPEPTLDEQEIYYAKFKTWMVYFPFLSLPPDQTAEELRKERPFTWACIMNITSMSMPQIIMLRERVREEASKRVVFEGERTLDVLQGLILYIAWANLNAGPNNKPFLMVFCQLAVCIMWDLELARSPDDQQYYTGSFKVLTHQRGPPKIRTMEERRTVLALWYMTSVATSFFGKMETLRWTPHMEECLNVLDRTPEVPTDEILCVLIKLQLLADETNQLLVRDATSEPSQTPTYVFRKGLLQTLQEIRDRTSSNTLENRMVSAQYHATELIVQSVGLYRPEFPSAQKVDGMYRCMKAVQSWYDVFFDVPLEELMGMPLVLFIQLSQTHVALYKLTTVEEPSWDKEMLRNSANLLTLLDQTVDRFLQAGQAYKFRADAEQETLFSKGVKMIRGVKSNWEPVLTQHLNGIPTPNSHFMATNIDSTHALMSGHQSNNISPALMPDPTSTDFNDLAWMFDIFGPWEF